MSRRLQILLFAACFALALCSVGPPLQAAPSPKENEVKAVLVFHLTRFVSWAATPSNDTAFVIGVLGPDPFGGALDAVVKGEKLGERPILVKRATMASDLRDCQIVYVSPEAREADLRIFETLGASSILTVGESSDFLVNGGMIRFKKNPERKLRLEVNLRRIRDHGLNVSAQLLRVSDVTDGGEGR